MTKRKLNNSSKTKTSYKDPIFLFTSGSLRQAAWAGWYAALGDKKQAEGYKVAAMAEWTKEIGSIRGYSFLKKHSREIYSYVPKEALSKLLDDFLKEVKKEIRKGKAFSIKKTKF
jgi:hypothetical protein